MRLYLAILLIAIFSICPSQQKHANKSKLKNNYDRCSHDSNCRSGHCALTGTDYGNGEPQNKVDNYACVPAKKLNLGDVCKKQSQCASHLCGCTMDSCHCVASNRGLNGDACSANSDCFSGKCYFDLIKGEAFCSH